jgi:hypothetical protein
MAPPGAGREPVAGAAGCLVHTPQRRKIMFEKRKEVVVRDQPANAVEPQVVEKTVYVEDKRPRFMLGLVIGILLLAGGVALFAQHEGSYTSAGARVDHSLTSAQADARGATHDAAQAVEQQTSKSE